MPTTHPEPVVRHYDTLLSPLESEEQPDWLQRASPEQRRRLQELQKTGRQARAQAMQAFSKLLSLYDFAKSSLSTLSRPLFTPAIFLKINEQQALSPNYQEYVDRSYQSYLKRQLESPTLLAAKQQAYLATLREEATIATIKGDLGKDGKAILKWILETFDSGSSEFTQKGPFVNAALTQISSLHLNAKVELDQIIVFGPDLDDAPCVAYVPGHPRHPLKQYKTRTDFFASLRRDWQHAGFQAFMRRFIPMSQQQTVFASWRDPDALITLPITCTPLDQGLRPYVSKRMVKRLLDDARYLLPESDKQAQALDNLDASFASMIEEHLMIGAGVGIRSGEEEEGLPPSDWITRLHPVLTDQGDTFWRPDLSPYRLPLNKNDAGGPDARGLYDYASEKAILINDAFYRVNEYAPGSWCIRTAVNTQAYSPKLYHNGAGAWHHSLERPEYWGRLALLRRLGPLTLDISDERLLLLGRVSGVTNAQLRRVYQLNQPTPALLRYALARERARNETTMAIELLKQGKPLPAGFEANVVTSFYEAVNAKRVRRNADDPTPSPQGQCDASCNAPPPSLFVRWLPRLIRGIHEHRFELAQIAPDATVLELRRRYPDMPLLLAQQLLDENREHVARELNQGNPLPLPMAELAQESAEQGRLTQALDGFMQPCCSNQDTWILAVRLMEFLPGWPPGAALLLREGGRFGPVLASLGVTDVESTVIYQDEDEGWFTVDNDQVLLAQDRSEYGFYRSLLYALNGTQRSQLGFGLNEAERLHQQLRELATARPLRAALLLDLPVRRRWLVAPAAEATYRAPDALASNRLFGHEPIRDRLVRLLTTADPVSIFRHRTAVVEDFIAQMLRSDVSISELTRQLEDERALLHRTFDNWVAQAGPENRRSARRRAADRLLAGWEARITLSQHPVHLNDEALDELPPLPVRLPAVNQLIVQSTQITHIPDAFLGNLPNLQTMDLSDLPLQALPPALGTLQRLRRLDLSRTRLAPSALSPLASLPQLEHLWLNDINNTLHSWTVEQMAYITSIRTLRSLEIRASSARFDPGVFAQLANLPALHTLELNSNDITLSPQDIQDLAGLVGLRRLNLSRNPLGLTPDVSRMLALEELDLSTPQTLLTQWPNGLERLPRIHCVNLRHMEISDVPVGAGAIRGLHMFWGSLPLPVRTRFLQERREAGIVIDWLDSTSDSDDHTSSDDSDEHVLLPDANWQTDTAKLLTGMSATEQEQVSRLVNGTDPRRAEFFSLLLRIHYSRQARILGAAMLQRIQAVIRGALSTQLRDALYETAAEAVNCVDLDALVFSQLETLAEADRILQEHTDESATAALLDLGTSHWRAHRLDHYVTQNFETWQQQGHTVDDAEVELYFRIALAERLRLRNQPVVQVHTTSTRWITQAMLDDGEAAVLADQPNLLPAYLLDQPYWQRYLDYAYAPRVAVIYRWRDRIGEYLDAMGDTDVLPPTLNDTERQHLHRVLVDSGRLPPFFELPADLSFNDEQVRAAYGALLRLVNQAKLDLTRDILLSQAGQDNEPQPGPSRRT
ncbi:NEL-type E3 ubiquitin ligase domain-containing protein [Pseudomonas tructae]|nr:NEL-type E3 ubiquitin ligase domain-containing protein [Pseudomonas tructae]